MPHGGKLTLETAVVSFCEEKAVPYPELKPGDYVMLAVTDTGTGMSPEVRARVFDPFFSTKGVGEGPGLGLATCYGIIKQSGGHINIYSEEARGTSIKIYLPKTNKTPHVPSQAPAPVALPRGTETVLLVEDDPALREMSSTFLSRLGYKVSVAANGMEALRLFEEPGGKSLDLLFTDMVMPELDGKALSERILELYPGVKILFTSAYTENAIVHQGMLSPGVALLQKPFTPSAMAHKVREVLDRS
jgi:CheY-like chemotaxis protein